MARVIAPPDLSHGMRPRRPSPGPCPSLPPILPLNLPTDRAKTSLRWWRVVSAALWTWSSTSGGGLGRPGESGRGWGLHDEGGGNAAQRVDVPILKSGLVRTLANYEASCAREVLFNHPHRLPTSVLNAASPSLASGACPCPLPRLPAWTPSAWLVQKGVRGLLRHLCGWLPGGPSRWHCGRP